MKHLTSHEGLHCANCGAPMQGEFCHECGQSIHSVLKPMHHMVEETVETVLHIDGRIVHTLPPLLLKPGFLTLEYFAGRRVRYIAPFRLMFVLCLLSFFVFHLAFDEMAGKALANYHPVVKVTGATFKDADTPREVRKALTRQLKQLPQIAATGLMPQHQIDLAAQDIQQEANKRLVELGAVPMPAASVAANLEAIKIKTGAMNSPVKAVDDALDHESQPVQISWLPDVANARLTAMGHRLQNNFRALRKGDAAARNEAKQRMINGVFGTLPPALFVMMPLFALLLKLFYVFRRRLYMEHLIVALHSHAFIFFGLLLILLTWMFSTWLTPHAAWAGYALGWVQTLLILWIPTYLLIMQKRIYRQGWPMTLLKFWCVGWCYFWLLVLVLIVATMLGIAH